MTTFSLSGTSAGFTELTSSIGAKLFVVLVEQEGGSESDDNDCPSTGIFCASINK